METIDDARQRRDAGIEAASAHAEWDAPGWSAAAYDYLLEFLRGSEDAFLGEQLVAYAHEQGLPEPPDRRAWGAVFAKARRAHVICQRGFGRARSSNLAPKPLWQRC